MFTTFNMFEGIIGLDENLKVTHHQESVAITVLFLWLTPPKCLSNDRPKDSL